MKPVTLLESSKLLVSADTIGIDLHGVIDSHPNAFRNIMRSSILLGRSVYVVSGPPEADIEAELLKYDIHEIHHFHRIITIVDFLKEEGVKMWTDEKGRWWANDEDWWGAKAKMCKLHNIDLMLDDKEKYGPYFENIETRFLLYGG